jgi:hypothetical protein
MRFATRCALFVGGLVLGTAGLTAAYADDMPGHVCLTVMGKAVDAYSGVTISHVRPVMLEGYKEGCELEIPFAGEWAYVSALADDSPMPETVSTTATREDWAVKADTPAAPKKPLRTRAVKVRVKPVATSATKPAAKPKLRPTVSIQRMPSGQQRLVLAINQN